MESKLVGFLISALMITTVIPVLGTTVNNTYIKERVESIIFSEPIIKKEKQYIIIDLKEATSYLTIPGEPILPLHIKVFKFPIGTKIEEVECRPLQIKEKIISNEIKPSPEHVLLIYTRKIFEEINVKNEFVYKSSDLYPKEWYYCNVGCGLDGSNRVIFLTIGFYPIWYSPAQNLIQYVNKVDIKIKYSESKKLPVFSDVSDLLIITPSEFSSALNPFVSYKNNKYVKTKIVFLENIPSQGLDTQESIKYFIKNEIETSNIKYVLLVGSANKFPVRYSWIPYAGYEDNFPSDLYYADVYKGNMEFASWDADKDGKHGEYPTDNNEIDIYPDVYLARIPCNNINEVTTVINKIINFEENNVWKDNIIVCGGDTVLGDNESIDEGEYINQEVLTYMNGFDSTRLWVPGGSPGSGDKLLSTANIIFEINKGLADFVDFEGHGWYDRWATHPHEDEDWIRFKTSDLSLLTNTDKFPIVFLDGCFCSKFTEDSNCIGWSLIKRFDAGAIATFGSSGISYGGRGTSATKSQFGYISCRLHEGIYNNRVIGEVWGGALNDYVNNVGLTNYADYKTVEEFILFGDPTLTKIRSDNNQPNKPDLPKGPIKIKINSEYNYSSISNDPDNDSIYYLFDWGDGTYSGWLGLYESGESCVATNSWNEKGTFELKVKTKDIWGAESYWSEPLVINITKSKSFMRPPIFNWFTDLLLERLLMLDKVITSIFLN